MTTKSKQSTGSKFNHPHMIIPAEDTTWAVNQKSSVLRFWQQCWLADPYGSRWMKLVTNLSDSAFRLAKRVLESASLFVFRRLSTGNDGRTSIWEVKNLHGARVKDFWLSEKAKNPSEVSPQVEEFSQKNKANTASNKADIASVKANTASNKASTRIQTQSEQEFHQVSGTAQEHITNSSNEFVMCVSDPLTGNLRVEETAHAPLRVASPQSVESVSELEEELPAVTDCTTLALVEAVQGESASLLAENQECGVEAAVSHEGTCSAAPVSLNQSEIFEWLDRANLGECPPLWVIQYLLDSKYYASMRASISKFEKQWNLSVVNYQVQKSSEALFTSEDIAIRSKARLLRMERLKMASQVGKNPGFDFLHQCWNDDPALQIVIKKLLVKFPQWGIVIVDGVLVDWEG